MSEDAERDLLAIEAFGEKWFRWASLTGPKARHHRSNMRRTAPAVLKVRQLREAGASCASCQSTSRRNGQKPPPMSNSYGAPGLTMPMAVKACTGSPSSIVVRGE